MWYEKSLLRSRGSCGDESSIYCDAEGIYGDSRSFFYDNVKGVLL